MKWEMKAPSYGDMIRVELGGIYHMGIYVSDDEVIQFGLPPTSRRMMRDDEVEVLASDIDAFLAGGFLEVCVFDRRERKQNRTPEETVQYARSKLGMRGYNILYNNCEHFANTCVCGRAVSDQTERIRQLVRGLPLVDVYFAKLPDQPIGAPLECKARWDYVCGISNEQVKREKYYVWKLLEYAVDRSFGIKPSCLTFAQAEDGSWYADRYAFSISHSGDMLAVAVSRDPVGMDVERVRGLVSDAIAGRILTQAELAEYAQVPAEEQQEYLVQMWTAKEAIFKSHQVDAFVPHQVETSQYALRQGALSQNGEVYLWTVTAKTLDMVCVRENVTFL